MTPWFGDVEMRTFSLHLLRLTGVPSLCPLQISPLGVSALLHPLFTDNLSSFFVALHRSNLLAFNGMLGPPKLIFWGGETASTEAVFAFNFYILPPGGFQGQAAKDCFFNCRVMVKQHAKHHHLWYYILYIVNILMYLIDTTNI